MKVARLLLRLIVGAIFVGHGTQKLFGWFGGPGLDTTAQGFDKMGMRPGRHHAAAASAAETGGGALLIAGLATPFAASALISVMLTAINRVHFKNGFWNSNGGYEFNLVLVGALLALAEEGPGSLALGGEGPYGPGWAAAALAGGVIGAAGAHAYAAAQPEPQPAAPAEPPAAEAAPEAVAEPQPASS